MGVTLSFSVPGVPGFYIEQDGSRASEAGVARGRVLCLGQRRSAGTVAKEILTFVPSAAAGRTYFGRGSILAREIEAVFAQYPMAEVWAIAQDDPAGVAATGKVVIAGTASESGAIHLYLGGQYLAVPVTSGDVAATVATLARAMIVAAADLPVTAAGAAGDIDLTARNIGLTGNQIDVRVNYLGTAGGEKVPAGLTATVTPMSGGTLDPTLTASITAMADNAYDTIVHHYPRTTPMSAMKTELASRWGAIRMLYGHCFSAILESYANLVIWGTGSQPNDAHLTVIGYQDTPAAPWEVAGRYAGWYAEHYADADTASLGRGPIRDQFYDILAPPQGSEFTVAERAILDTYGLTTWSTDNRSVYLSGLRTTYLTDSSSTPDTAFAEARTMAILTRLSREWPAQIWKLYAGSALVADSTRVGGGIAVCSPALVRGDLIGLHAEWEGYALCQDADQFAADLIVEINGTDPNRLDILLPPTLSGWLKIIAIRNQFRL